MKQFISATRKPPDGTIVEIKTKKDSCSCAGYQRVECYYDSVNGFNGIKNQAWVKEWRISPANDLINDLEKKKCYVAIGCDNCMS